MIYKIKHKGKFISGEIEMVSSKSESNRALIIRYLSGDKIDIINLSTSKDTIVLATALAKIKAGEKTIDVGACGTAYRFLTALLSITEGEHILTGDERMQERPIKFLVDTLISLGADIEYMREQGFPPLKITGKKLKGGRFDIDASVSSQYVSALALIAPYTEEGLRLCMTGTPVSSPYIQLTLSMIEQCGIECTYLPPHILIPSGEYSSQTININGDWTTASYFFALAALSESANITIKGLSLNSLQGDEVITNWFRQFGVYTACGNNQIRIQKTLETNPVEFIRSFSQHPDLAQTFAVLCALKGIPAVLSGLQTLNYKETNRLDALNNELKKLNCPSAIRFNNALYIDYSENSNSFDSVIKTYNDHRMAMAFSLAAMRGDVMINNPEVCEKSCPTFFEDLKKLGFVIETIE